MRKLIELIDNGGVGYILEQKEHGWVRIMFKNWNSLGVFTHSWKIDRLNYLIKWLNVDIVMGCKSQCDWTMVETDRHFLNLLTPGTARKGIALHNSHEHNSKGTDGWNCNSGDGTYL